jgi:hypothetical protein
MAGKFFPVDREVLTQLLTHFRGEHWVQPVLAYLVLCKHQQRGQPFTTAGSLAIAKTLGVTRYQAENFLRELEKIQWGQKPNERCIVTPQVLKECTDINVPSAIGLFQIKGLPRLGQECIYLPNSLFEGKNGKPPIQKINSISDRLPQYDALTLLLYSYAYHDMEGTGGLDVRKTIYAPWCYEGACLDGEVTLGYQGSAQDFDRTWHFWLVTNGENWVAQKPFIDVVTEGDSDRFFEAVRLLKEQGFLVEVAMVFDRDPLQSCSAEPLYPLRIFDALYRNNARQEGTGKGGLYAEAFNCLVRSRIMDELVGDFCYQIFSPEREGESSGFYAVPAQMKSTRVLSVYRLRFWPHDRDHGIGFQVEENRAATWKEKLSNAFR